MAFLYLAYTLLEPNFSYFHDIVSSSEVAASGRKRIPQLRCARVNLIPRLIGEALSLISCGLFVSPSGAEKLGAYEHSAFKYSTYMSKVK